MRPFLISVGSLYRVLFSAALLALLTACAGSGPKLPPAPVTAASPDYNYVVGPGDNLNIIVWRNPELSMTVPVRPDGKISTPLVDELVAQGKTSVQIARDVRKLDQQVRARSDRHGHRDQLCRPLQ